MQNCLKIIKALPSVLLRLAHVIKHIFCDINSCDMEE